METNKENIDKLLEKLEELLKKQYEFSKEINDLRGEINKLKTAEEQQEIKTPVSEPEVKEPVLTVQKQQTPPVEKTPAQLAPMVKKPAKGKFDLEKFIGENLINKIGIIIIVIGVSIGVKYAIDHDLISPLTRIILGYLFGTGLLGFAMALRKKYENFSAVLLSGALAILYFITFAAYSFYELIPQILAFALMVIFTVFTVIASLSYNQQVIAHIGLVGAYAVPFLLSNDSGRAEVLFSYTAIINAGILAISVRKYWKPVYYSAFVLSWLIYFSWYATSYQMDTHFGIALIFVSVFFVIFYLTFLIYKLRLNEKFRADDILLLLANSFIFYGIGYDILENHETGKEFLGLFTLVNAIVHFIAGSTIRKRELADKNLFYLVTGLVLVFITIAFPVQFDGNWVTLLWAGEAALLFWIGRTKNIAVYEYLSYPLIYLAFFSLIQDWNMSYGRYIIDQSETRINPLLNIHFLSSILFIGAFGFIQFINTNKNHLAALSTDKLLSRIISFSIPTILLISIYYAFRIEISTYWDQLIADSVNSFEPGDDSNMEYYLRKDLIMFRNIWLLNYSLAFVSLLALANIKKFKNEILAYINISLIVLIGFSFLISGLFMISELRESYLDQTLPEFYPKTAMYIGIRYISLAFFASSLVALYYYTRQAFIKPKLYTAFEILLFTSVLWVASSELIHWMDIAGWNQSYKLALSIFWGSYSLLLIILGIWRKKPHFRIGAMVLFGITLLKLFFYDLANLDTISKTIVFVSLGVLLLIISFLYIKYKHLIRDEIEN